MKEIITIGEPMTLFAAQQEGELENIKNFKKYLAGADLNVGIGLSRLGYNVSYITRLGKDPFGRYIYSQLIKNNINTKYVNYDNKHLTGFMLKSMVKQGDPKVFYFRQNSAASHINNDDIKKVDFSKISWIHITGITLGLSKECRQAVYLCIDMAKKHNIKISFDPNLRADIWDEKEEMKRVTNHVASLSDIVLPGINEGEILMGSRDPEEIADFYLNMGTKLVVIKLGKEGAYVKGKEQKASIVKGYKVEKVVDTVGAGDGFSVGVISGLIENLSINEAVKRGNAIGALAVMSPGDNDGLPSREGLEKFMNCYD